MWIIDPDKRFTDGRYHVDYGAVAMVVLGLLRWRWIARNFSHAKVRDRIPGLPDVVRVQVEVDFDRARMVANDQAWDYLPKIYGWIDARGHSGEQVIAELVNLARRADGFRRSYELAARGAMQSSMASVQASLDVGDMVIFGLEATQAVAKATLGATATLASGGTFAAAVLGKAALSATELQTKGVSVVCTALNVGADLMIDVGKYHKQVGDGFAVVAKGVNKGVGAYMSGKDLSDAIVEGLVETAFQGAGKLGKDSPKALAKLLNAQRGRWMIPLRPLSAPPKGPLSGLTSLAAPQGDKLDVLGKAISAAVKDGGKLVKDAAKARGKHDTALAADLSVSPASVLVADIGLYETMVRRAIYRL